MKGEADGAAAIAGEEEEEVDDVEVRFRLAAGCFATMMIREFLKVGR